VLWHERPAIGSADYTPDAGHDGRTEPVGIVCFSPTSLDDENRREKFGGKRFSPAVVNKWFSFASRVVIDPRYRGAGIAAEMFREACRIHADLDSVKYIEAKTSMGSVNHFIPAAGFERMGIQSQLDQDIGDRAGGLLEKMNQDTHRFRKIHKYIMDTEDEFDISVR
jgi:GNAT superfamily N-acetyltransferase